MIDFSLVDPSVVIAMITSLTALFVGLVNARTSASNGRVKTLEERAHEQGRRLLVLEKQLAECESHRTTLLHETSSLRRENYTLYQRLEGRTNA